MNLADRTGMPKIDIEDDKAQIQVSGGFGDSSNLDAAALQIAFTGE